MQAVTNLSTKLGLMGALFCCGSSGFISIELVSSSSSFDSAITERLLNLVLRDRVVGIVTCIFGSCSTFFARSYRDWEKIGRAVV